MGVVLKVSRQRFGFVEDNCLHDKVKVSINDIAEAMQASHAERDILWRVTSAIRSKEEVKRCRRGCWRQVLVLLAWMSL